MKAGDMLMVVETRCPTCQRSVWHYTANLQSRPLKIESCWRCRYAELMHDLERMAPAPKPNPSRKCQNCGARQQRGACSYCGLEVAP